MANQMHKPVMIHANTMAESESIARTLGLGEVQNWDEYAEILVADYIDPHLKDGLMVKPYLNKFIVAALKKRYFPPHVVMLPDNEYPVPLLAQKVWREVSVLTDDGVETPQTGDVVGTITGEYQSLNDLRSGL